MKKLIKNNLGYDSNISIYQDKDMFNYSIDTILLGNFISLNNSTKKILEVGTNNGVLSIFLSERSSQITIDAIEIQKQALVIAKKNVKLNKKTKQINLILVDFNKYWLDQVQKHKPKYDAIICNPPFYKLNASLKKIGSESFHLATHEIKLTLEDLIKGAAQIIKQKGYLAIVEPTERLVDICEFMRKYGFEPKKIQFVHSRENKKSNLVLVEGRFKVGWGTEFKPNLYLHNKDPQKHEYRDEIKVLYKPLKVGGK